MSKRTRPNTREDVLGFAGEHAWQPRSGSNVHTFIPVLLERLEAENAQLRGSVVELVLQIHALRDILGHPQSETTQYVPSAFGPQRMISFDGRRGTAAFSPLRFLRRKLVRQFGPLATDHGAR